MHLFLTRLKCLLRTKELIFWTFLFPIALSTFFFFAFGNITSGEAFQTIPLAVVTTDQLEDEFVDFLTNASMDGEKAIFEVTQTTLDLAQTQLANNEVVGYIVATDALVYDVTFKNAGIKETIVKVFLDNYVQVNYSMLRLFAAGYTDIEANLNDIIQSESFILNQNASSQLDVRLNYFFSLLGMALIYGGFWGTNEIINLQPNLSSTGVRVCVGPTKRWKLLLSNMSAALLIHFSGILLFLLFLRFVLGVSLGERTGFIVLISLVGSACGISFGAFVGITLKKANEGLKTGLTAILGVLGGFLSGMMYAGMKFWVIKNAPILTFINPVFFINDGLFSLYAFSDLTRFTQNLLLLLAMTLIFMIATILQFRRDDYESI